MADWGDAAEIPDGQRADSDEMPMKFLEAWVGTLDHRKMVNHYTA